QQHESCLAIAATRLAAASGAGRGRTAGGATLAHRAGRLGARLEALASCRPAAESVPELGVDELLGGFRTLRSPRGRRGVSRWKPGRSVAARARAPPRLGAIAVSRPSRRRR